MSPSFFRGSLADLSMQHRESLLVWRADLLGWHLLERLWSAASVLPRRGLSQSRNLDSSSFQSHPVFDRDAKRATMYAKVDSLHVSTD